MKRKCRYCSTVGQDLSLGHLCQTNNLPTVVQQDGKYALRHHAEEGYLLWVDIDNGEFAGKSYTVGAVADPENFYCAVDEAEEESRVLAAQAREEFGF